MRRPTVTPTTGALATRPRWAIKNAFRRAQGRYQPYARLLGMLGRASNIPCRWAALGLLPFLLGACGPNGETFRGRPAWQLENDQLRVTIVQGGGHIAALVLKPQGGGEAVNPLWIPPWPSIEPSGYSPEMHGEIYGRTAEASLLAGIMGHNVCFDVWGEPSASEVAAGLPFHGEASNRLWRRLAADEGRFTYRVEMPLAQKSLTRTLRLLPGTPVLYFEEVAQNHLGLDQPMAWVQHVTFGPPFLDRDASFFDASATVGDMTWEEKEVRLNWQQPPENEPEFNFRRFSRLPKSRKIAYFLLDPQRDLAFVSAVNTDQRLLALYLFRRQDYPWLVIWEENHALSEPPWNGETMTRGMEFGNTRISGTAKSFFAEPTRYDTPTFGWLDAKSKKTVRYLAVLLSVPEGFTGVQDVQLDGTEIVIAGRGVTEPIRVRYEPLYFEPPGS